MNKMYIHSTKQMIAETVSNNDSINAVKDKSIKTLLNSAKHGNEVNELFAMMKLNTRTGFKEVIVKQKSKTYKPMMGHAEHNKRVGDTHEKVAEIRREVSFDVIG